MKKVNFNAKLTAFMVSLFLSLIIVILGNKFKVCLCFGFILMGLALVFYVLYNNEKTTKMIGELRAQTDSLTEYETIAEEEKGYMLKQLYIAIDKVQKRQKRVQFVFYGCALALVILAIASIF